MSDEIKVTEEKHEHKCICQSKEFRGFLIIALGTFVGFFCAMSLFAALHKPPMMYPSAKFGPHSGMMRGCPCKMIHHHHHFDKSRMPQGEDFQPAPVQEAGRRTPFEAPRPNMR